MSKLNHTVMFKIHDDVSDDDVAKAVELLNGLGSEPGVERWVIRESIDKRKGRIIIEHSLFESDEAYQTFRVSPAHVKVGDFMKTIADWWVGDYLED